MRRVLHFLLLVAFNVRTYVSQDINANLIEHPETATATTLSNHISPLTPPPKPKFVLTENVCYVGHSMCYQYHRAKGNQQKEVCAYHKDYKLIDFENQCDMYLQNCLYRAEREAKIANVPDVFYYNKHEKPCKYYFEKGKTLEDAVKFYYLDGLKQNLPKKKKKMMI